MKISQNLLDFHNDSLLVYEILSAIFGRRKWEQRLGYDVGREFGGKTYLDILIRRSLCELFKV